jgi:ribosome biogenesis GTPase A
MADWRIMSIHWFPGHMTKAKREIESRLSMVDCIIELRDSRLPLSSRNPLIDELGKDKPRLIVLTKKDMSDPLKTAEWVKKLQETNTVVISLNLLKDDTRKLIVDGVLKVMEPKFERWKSRGIQPRAVKAMVLGIPNVGKSTLINQLAKKKLMTVANKPGVTMALKWANVHPKLDILDTPGLLWGRFEDHEVAIKLALSGSIAEKVLPIEELCDEGFKFILKDYPLALSQRYGYEGSDLTEFLTVIAKKRGYVQNGEYKLNESMVTFLRELRQGDLGPMSME